MVRRTGFVVGFIMAVMLAAGGCAGRSGTQPETETEVEEMDVLDAARKAEEILGCDARTAESILKTCRQAGIGEITDMEEEPDDIYTILKVTADSTDYYLFLSDGYFLEQIRKETIDGEQIYMAME